MTRVTGHWIDTPATQAVCNALTGAGHRALFVGGCVRNALLGEPVTRGKPLFWEYGRDASYLRPGRKRDQSPNLAIRDGRWKLLINDDGSRLELYDFEVSANETTNVADLYPQVARRLSHMLLRWRRSFPAPSRH